MQKSDYVKAVCWNVITQQIQQTWRVCMTNKEASLAWVILLVLIKWVFGNGRSCESTNPSYCSPLVPLGPWCSFLPIKPRSPFALWARCLPILSMLITVPWVPGSPFGPTSPLWPFIPWSPLAPWDPAVPLSPLSPCAPLTPFIPAGPGSPFAPVCF